MGPSKSILIDPFFYLEQRSNLLNCNNVLGPRTELWTNFKGTQQADQNLYFN